MLEAYEKGETTTLAAVLERRRQKLGAALTLINMNPADMARAQAIAEKSGLPYQALLERLIHEGLDREDQRLAS